jgi:hypothetical protein
MLGGVQKRPNNLDGKGLPNQCAIECLLVFWKITKRDFTRDVAIVKKVR